MGLWSRDLRALSGVTESGNTPAMKFLIVDDHPVLREGIAALLRRAGPEVAMLEAGTVPEALRLAEANDDLDVVILDMVLPGMDGLRAIGEFGRVRPEVPVIVLSSSEKAEDARRALASGALGYVPKSASHNTLLAAISLVMDGEVYVPPLVLAEVTGTALPQKVPPSPADVTASALTARQVEVLRRLSSGQPNKIIAYELDLSEKTVKAHVTAIFKVLGAINRTQAAAAARAAGLI